MIRRQFLYYKESIIHPLTTMKNLNYVSRYFKFENLKTKNVDITTENFKIMKKAFKNMILCMPNNIDVVKFFLEAELDYLCKKIDIMSVKDRQPVLICVEKDDIVKIKELYYHCKKIGIEHFVFIDNGSTDGTIEFLSQKDNVDIIKSNTKYQTLAREAWINRVLCHYGYNHWYLVVDSDEMYNYVGSENIKISEHIGELEKKGIKRELSFMLDMYSKGKLFAKTENFLDECCYFDTDTYSLVQYRRFIRITGGPRNRVFEEDGKNKEFMLGKYPLFLFEKGDLQTNSHFTFPFYKNVNVPCTSVLMHYKFIGNDIEKYIKRVEEKNYSNGSEDYKAYINKYENEENTSFYYEKSEKYIDSKSLLKINILSKLN